MLWRKLPGARSAGRVQSVALRLVCDREAEIEAFRTDEYWTIEALLATAKRRGRPSPPHRHRRHDAQEARHQGRGDDANAIKAALIEHGDFRVASVEKKATKRNPYAPFTTSTLQMDASRKLGFSAKQTMQIAQRLYEGVDIGGETVGLITYMRTDGVQIVPEAVASHPRRDRTPNYGKNYTPVRARVQNQGQERPGSARGHPPDRPARASRIRCREATSRRIRPRLYDLIWKRTIASQMASAEVEQTTAEIEVKGARRQGLRRCARTAPSFMFDGFLKVYEEGRDDRVRTIDKGKDDAVADDDDNRRLPPLASGDRLNDKEVSADQHFTQPPPRFSEATLVKRMEELGIGRPSTYASTMAVLQ